MGVVALSWLTAGCVRALEPSQMGWAADADDRPSTARADVTFAVIALRYELDAVAVAVDIHNGGARPVTVAPSGVFLAWEGVEFLPRGIEDSPGAIAPGERGRITLRYAGPRPGPGSPATLVFRTIERDGVAWIDLPRIELPLPSADPDPRPDPGPDPNTSRLR